MWPLPHDVHQDLQTRAHFRRLQCQAQLRIKNMRNVHIRIFAQSRMIEGSHIHFRHEGNSDVVRTTRDSPLGEGSDCESNMCDRTFRICVGSGWGLRRSGGGESVHPTLATEALTTAQWKLVIAASACLPSSDGPWPPINQYWTCVS